MIYIMLLTVFVALLTILALVIYAFNKLPRSYFFFLFLTLITSLIVALKIYERNFKLSVVPDALQVGSIAYSKEESWGFGPGGNEAGIGFINYLKKYLIKSKSVVLNILKIYLQMKTRKIGGGVGYTTHGVKRL